MDNTSSINVLFPSLPCGLHEFAASCLVLVQPTFLVLCLLVSLFVVKAKGKSRKKPILPPGPTPWPIIGNIPEILSKKNKPTYRWINGFMKELNTDIACIRLANTHVISVTSPEIAREFLKKHDAVFASRPVTMATEYSSRGFLTIAVVPWGDQWKKMRKVMASEIMTAARPRSLLYKRTEEVDNLVRFIYNQCKSNSGSSAVINLRLAARQCTGNVIRKMLLNRRYFGEGRKDGGPGYEEVEYIESVFTVLRHLYSFILSDYHLGRNPKVWDEPLGFKPERHLKDGCIEEVDLTETELRFISFSTGRRGCMGVALGSAMTVMVLARLIQGFSWRVPSNEANIDLSVSENDLFMAKPLHAMAKPRLPGEQLYPPY
ncbi:hypothetical protein GOBAR_DD31069 [Gossypium barbadense]|nr:hypothetical protein GOBAR_DD31069 [Gossypium barbadense]